MNKTYNSPARDRFLDSKLIFKYHIPLGKDINFSFPVCSDLILFDSQEERLFIWMLFYTDDIRRGGFDPHNEYASTTSAPPVSIIKRIFRIFSTGEHIPAGYVYKASTVTPHNFVWHLFEKRDQGDIKNGE